MRQREAPAPAPAPRVARLAPTPARPGRADAAQLAARLAALRRAPAVQLKAAEAEAGPASPAPRNETGLPDRLKVGVEALSGLAMDDVRVHYRSPKPAQLQALAYAQGTDIHIAPGQEQHLPHEAWHVVQQKQGRVAPTLQMKGVSLNADCALEREADALGARAAAYAGLGPVPTRNAAAPAAAVIQRVPTNEEKELLRARVGMAYGNYTFQTSDGIELAMGLRDYYRLIRTKTGMSYWRRQTMKHSGGRGFYGRLVDKPPTMEEIGSNRAFAEALLTAPESYFAKQVSFVAGTSLGKRDNHNRVMGSYFLGQGQMPASIYALTADCEWLHMQGHGLGGSEVPENLYAGSNAANSHMAAVETAVQALRMLPGATISVRVYIRMNEDYHSPEICQRIANELKLPADAVFAAMAKTESRMPDVIVYDVLVNGDVVWSETIDPLMGGRFDEGSFRHLQLRVMTAIKKLKPEPIAFVFGGTLNPSTNASAVSTASSSNSSTSSSNASNDSAMKD